MVSWKYHLTFKQIANCNFWSSRDSDGEVAKGIKGYNPIISGQLREEIDLSSKDQNRPLQIKNSDIEILIMKKIKRYIPLSKDKINLIQPYG